MVRAARETLKVLGMDKHEALLVGHNDEPHPHIHVIVNRGNPETGIAAPLKMDHLKLSAWAEAYEKRQGQIRCEQRVENNERRRRGEFVKDWTSVRQAEFQRWRTDRVNRSADRRVREGERLDAKQAAERDQLRARRDRAAAEGRGRFREAHRGDWRDLYTIQRQERRTLADAQKSAWTRLRFFLRTPWRRLSRGRQGRPERHMLKGAAAALAGSRKQEDRLERKQKNERLFFAERLKRKADRLKRPIEEQHKKELAELRKRHDNEWRTLRARQSEESKSAAREITSGRDKAQFDKEQRGRLRQEMREIAHDVTASKAPAKSPSLSDRFAKARGLASIKPGSQVAGRKPSEQSAEQSAGRPDIAKEVPEQAKSHPSGSLSDKFTKAQAPGKTKSDQFKDNASDISKDAGREITRKPPK